MKILCFIPFAFLAACSTHPKVAVYPLPASPAVNNSSVRYPEVVRAYHVGRYADPNNDLVMHEQHVVYRVEENTRWDLRPPQASTTSSAGTFSSGVLPRDAAFTPLPVNDAVLAEVNAQKLATVQIMSEARILSVALAQFQIALQQTKTNLQETAVLRAAIIQMQKRLAVLEAMRVQPPTTNAMPNQPPDSLRPENTLPAQ